MNCKKKMIALIHKYLDGEASEQEKAELYSHLDECNECKVHFDELKKTIAFIQSSSHIEAPEDFTANVLSQLPEQKKTTGWKLWLKRHPMFVAASLFLLLMAASVFSVWTENQQLTVAGHANVQIDKSSSTVTVPAGEVVEGDLVIRNGTLEIDGHVKGNVVVINGEQYLSSTGSVTGEIEEINQIVEWVWYHIKDFFLDIF